MACLVEYFVITLTINWYYYVVRDATVVMTTTKAYTVLHLGHLDDAAKVSTTPAPADLQKFL